MGGFDADKVHEVLGIAEQYFTCKWGDKYPVGRCKLY
jgi:hypothetical protein